MQKGRTVINACLAKTRRAGSNSRQQLQGARGKRRGSRWRWGNAGVPSLCPRRFCGLVSLCQRRSNFVRRWLWLITPGQCRWNAGGRTAASAQKEQDLPKKSPPDSAKSGGLRKRTFPVRPQGGRRERLTSGAMPAQRLRDCTRRGHCKESRARLPRTRPACRACLPL